MPADGSELSIDAVVAHAAVSELRNPIAVLARRLRATQSPPTNADVRGRIDLLEVGFLRARHDPVAWGAEVESAQVRCTSG